LCTAYLLDELTREQAEAVIQVRRDAAREMGRRKARRPVARARIAPLTATGTVQDISAIVRGRDAEAARRDAQAGELLGCSGWTIG